MAEKRRTSTGLRFPEDLHAAMTAEARARGLTLNWLVVHLCREGMERLIPASELRLTRPAAPVGEADDPPMLGYFPDAPSVHNPPSPGVTGNDQRDTSSTECRVCRTATTPRETHICGPAPSVCPTCGSTERDVYGRECEEELWAPLDGTPFPDPWHSEENR